MGECGCVYVDVDGCMELSSTKYPVARKEHKCGECRKVIVPGEKYESVSGMYDGHFDTYKTCLDCVSMRDAFFCNGYHYTMIWEDFGEHLREMGGSIDADCIAQVSGKARDRICDAVEEYWEEREEDDA